MKNSRLRYLTEYLNIQKLVRYFKDYSQLLSEVPGLLFGLAIAIIGLTIPRNRNLWLVGSWFGDRFADNGKWFFLESLQDKEINTIYSTRNAELYLQLRQQGFPVVLSNTLRGIWTALRAGVYLYDMYPVDANFWAIKGALWVQMWHGVPLKRIERDISDPQHSLVEMLTNLDAGRTGFRLRALLSVPWRLRKEDIACCTSERLVPLFSSAFGIPNDRVRVTGYPRNDVLYRAQEKLAEWGVAPCDELLKAKARGKRVLLYVPTFREGSERMVFEHTWTAGEQSALHDLLRRLNALMLVKLHPHVATGWKCVEGIDTIQCLPSKLDLYPLLNQVDVLITDYSSIYCDYLLLGRPVIFYCYDFSDYKACRGFYFDYEQVTPGPKARTFRQLMGAIEATLEGSVDFSEEIARVRNLFHKFSDGRSSERIAMEVWRELASKTYPQTGTALDQNQCVAFVRTAAGRRRGCTHV